MTTSRWCSIQERHILPEALQYFDSLWIADHFYGFDAPEVTPGGGCAFPAHSGSLSSRTSPTALSRTQRPLSQPLPRPASSPRAPFYHASCRDTPFELPIRTETLLTCYQQTDEGEMREALEMQDNRYLMGPFEKAHICPRA